ncbi:MAG: hypothetical protein RLZZ115_662, partial [Cyanobacteriota bacterium]
MAQQPKKKAKVQVVAQAATPS